MFKSHPPQGWFDEEYKLYCVYLCLCLHLLLRQYQQVHKIKTLLYLSSFKKKKKRDNPNPPFFI